MANKKFQLATEKNEWIYEPLVIETNCIDKKKGHQYEWILKSNPLHDEILSEHPREKGFGICLCLKCNKVTFST